MTDQPNEAVTAVGSLLTGAGGGGATVAATVLLFRLQQGSGGSPGSSGAAVLTAGALGGLIVAAFLAFWKARTFGVRWQRVALGVLAPFGTTLLGYAAVPLDAAWGPPGLAGLVVACLLMTYLASRWVDRSGGMVTR